MMNYQEFKEKTRKEFANFLPEQYRKDIVFKDIEQGLHVMDGIMYGEDTPFPLVLYIETLYVEYRITENFYATLKTAAEGLVKLLEKTAEITAEKFKKNIIFQLVNGNKKKPVRHTTSQIQ